MAPDDRKPDPDEPGPVEPRTESPVEPPAEPAADTSAEDADAQPDAQPDAPTAAYPAGPPPRTPRPDRFRRVRTFAGHRATQLVAVLVLGLALGAGITALVVDDRDDHRMHSRSVHGPGRDHDRGDHGDRGGWHHDHDDDEEGPRPDR